ncbi:hypothetical protein ARSEF4850_006205 [Beauveria asiatica]
MTQSSDFEATNSVSPSPFILGPLTPASSTPEPSTPAEAHAGRREEDRLFRHFRGYTWSQRSRNTKSWVWEYGFDIEKGSDRRWVCRVCIERNRPKPGNVISIGTQNAERHLWDHHKILDPSGKRSAPVSRKKKTVHGIPDDHKCLQPQPKRAREQAIAKHIIKNFDKNVFQRLVVEWLVEGNPSFREPESKRLRDIFEYLNPLVASADAHISHDTVRKRAVAEFEKHKEKVIVSYEIPKEKIGYFTLDNAPNNDTAMDTIRERFNVYSKGRRGRCFSHVINLVVRVILFGKDADAFESCSRQGDNSATTEHELWRKKGPVGKLHNLVVAIHRSDVLTTLLRSIQRLESDASEDSRGHFESYGNVWDVVVGYEFLLAKLEKAKAVVLQYPEPEHFKVNINLAWKKLDEYYNKLDETPIYYTSLVLHPAYRWGYFETVWSRRPAWVARAKDIVQSVWDEEYKTLDIPLAYQDEPAAKRQRTQYYSPFERHKDEARIHCEEKRDTDKAEDEYARWQLDLLPTDSDIRDPREYWHAQRFKYPRLSRMAMDFMTIQAMSVECERLFSAAGRMVTPLRSQLESSTIAICQVLRSWLQSGIVEEIDPILLGKADETVTGQLVDENAAGGWLRDLPMQMREGEAGWE